MQDHVEGGEAREAIRREGVRGAVVIPGNGKGEFRCLLANIGDDGAELRLEPGQRVPPHFRLNVPAQGKIFRAEVRWREEGRVGVRFTGSEPAPVGLRVVGA